jgi:hypothetical protein
MNEERHHAIPDHPVAPHPVANAALRATQSPKKDIHHPRLIYAPDGNPVHPVTFDFVPIPKHAICAPDACVRFIVVGKQSNFQALRFP